MPEKEVNTDPTPNPSKWLPFSGHLLQWRFRVLTALVFVGMVVVWSLDGCTIKSFIESWRFKQQLNSEVSLLPVKPTNLTQKNHGSFALSTNITHAPPSNYSSTNIINVSYSSQTNNVSAQNVSDGFSQKPSSEGFSQKPSSEWFSQKPRTQELEAQVKWISTELEQNLTSNLLSRWLAPGGEVCRESRTVGILVHGLEGKDMIELTSGDVHEFGFQAVDEFNKPCCLGGDYFETDLSGESWKSRPLVKDFGNGSYSISLQVHPDFAGDYNLTIILLFRHFEGLKFSSTRFAYDKELLRVRIKFYKGHTQLPPLRTCEKSDFTAKHIWLGRWTRHGKNDGCQISNDGRYRCLAPDFPCQSPWCIGSLGSLESNGWVYSSHCSFRIFSADSAWNCLKDRWIFFWGDSNHVDTIRNMLNFVLDLPEIKAVPRRFDMNFSNPRDASQSVRITSIFNGHWNETQNYQGLNSLRDEGFRNLVKRYFSEESVPDTIIMNSGLHDGIFWSNIRSFSKGVYYAVSFWKEVLESIRQRGLAVPKIFYRTTVATGGYARTLAFNPNKMETFNWIVLDKFREAGLLSGVIDNFDMTFPWHFNNRCNDGVHYGRAPLKMKWKDGEIGHQYFVDLMLVHVLLNVLCQR